MHDSGVIVIALDESSSMKGVKWENQVNGAKKLIAHIKTNHTKLDSIQLVIIFFSKTARLILD